MDNSLKTATQSTLIHLNTADGSSMTALGTTTLQLWIADFKFLHNFIICDRLPDTEILFGIDVQKTFPLSYACNREKNCYIQKEGRLFTYTRNCKKKANVAIVKSTLTIMPTHNGIIPMKIKGHTIKGHMAYFISDQDSKKGRTPTYTSLMESITSKEEHMLKFLSQITPTTHIIFKKEEHVGHLELPIEDMQQIIEDSGSLTAHSITTKMMMAEKVDPDTFKPPHHKLRKILKQNLSNI